MLVRVKLMRRRGVRLSDPDFANSPAFEGKLTGAYLRWYFFASLRDPASPIAPSILPDLYEPALVGLGDHIMVLRGIERIPTAEGQMAVIQEWHCEVIGR